MNTSPFTSLSRRDFLKSCAAAWAVAGPTAALAAQERLSSVAKAGENLPHRTLGKTGVSVSALALGGVIGMQLPPSADHDPMAIAETALNLGVTYFDTAPSYNVAAMKVMGGGNGCLVTGNPPQKVLRPYHDQTAHQVNPASLIRYTLSLPVSVAVIGVASVEQLKANIRLVREATPMTVGERGELETAMG